MERLFTMKQVHISATIQLVIAGALTRKEAARLLGYSVRQIKRKVNAFKKNGKMSLIHGNTGRSSNNKTPDSTVHKILKLIKTKLQGFDLSHAADMLSKHYNIATNRETLRQLLIAHNLWHPSKAERLKHGWRERKAHQGEMLQGDGSYHIWFGKSYSTLLAFIDDATSRVELLFVEQETTEGMAQLLRTYIEKYGRPRALYTDRGKVFKVNKVSDDKPRQTQFQRMATELDIDFIHAQTPQAKGRVERLFRTLQNRLVKELAFYGITTQKEANKFLQSQFIDEFNKQFSNEPRKPGDLHQSLENINLNSIFCYKDVRILKRDRTIRYKNRWFLLDKKQPVKLYPSCRITICRGFDDTFWLTAKGVKLHCKEITEPKTVKRKEKPKVVSDKIYRPPKNHPWREAGRWR